MMDHGVVIFQEGGIGSQFLWFLPLCIQCQPPEDDPVFAAQPAGDLLGNMLLDLDKVLGKHLP